MLPERLANIRSRIKAACESVGRSPGSITIIAVTKTVSAEVANQAIEAGILDIGENRLQEYLRKRPLLRSHRFHFIGHLQTNKVKQVIRIVEMIHSVDSLHLAKEISKRATAADRTVDILLEINTSGEPSKYGFAPAAVEDAAGEIAALPGTRLRGLMTIASLVDDPEKVRPEFRMLASIQKDIRERLKLPDFDVLSMGMTNDFEVAIQEGATHIRLGTALFGSRR
ncbi:MAG: YggS family pyridoxal phosphate-dependent enzyme [Chlorobi bacterium]|nr:YggS family pyridoxal phosphate-dependent enzyme [Chlorobiota bacterium]